MTTTTAFRRTRHTPYTLSPTASRPATEAIAQAMARHRGVLLSSYQCGDHGHTDPHPDYSGFRPTNSEGDEDTGEGDCTPEECAALDAAYAATVSYTCPLCGETGLGCTPPTDTAWGTCTVDVEPKPKPIPAPIVQYTALWTAWNDASAKAERQLKRGSITLSGYTRLTAKLDDEFDRQLKAQGWSEATCAALENHRQYREQEGYKS